MPDLTLTGALVAAVVAEAGALVYVFKRVEKLVARGEAREDKLLSALLGKLDEGEESR